MTHSQCANSVAMVRPAAFAYNQETASNNFFQHQNGSDQPNLQLKALEQFDAMVELLLRNGLDVLVIEDSPVPAKPDAIFPNNWFSCNNGRITVFSMYANNRRSEKRPEVLKALQQKTGIDDIDDLSKNEKEGFF